MHFLLYAGLLVYLYLTTTVASKIGVVQISAYSLLLPSVYAIYFFTKINFHRLFLYYKIENLIILWALFFSIFKIFLGDLQDVKNITLFMVVPLLFYILISFQKIEIKVTIRKLIIFFFITECVLAICERIYQTLVFPYDLSLEYNILDGIGFRSNAFMGHPLSNALCVSTIMGFILVSDFKFNLKFFLGVMGYASLLCFNARGAILVWTVIIPFYFFLNGLRQSKGLMHRILLLALFASAVSIIYIIVSYGFGDRFFKGILIDGSAITRIKVFESFKYINSADFWLGNSKNYLYVMNKLGAGGVENSFIVVIINYGIVIASALFVLYFFWVRRILFGLKFNNSLLILSSFVLVGSMNNSLASSGSWTVFAICSAAFLSRTKERSSNTNRSHMS